MRIQILLLYIAMTFSVIAMAGETGSELAAVNAVLNDFHAAAAEGDKARYLGLMTDEAVISAQMNGSVGQSIRSLVIMSMVDSRMEPGGHTNR